MKKTIWIIAIVVLVGAGFFLWQKNKTTSSLTPTDQTSTTELSNFVSADQSITFNYPSTLSASQKNNIITLHHQIKYANHPACDFKGDASESPTLTDFNMTIQMFNLTIASTSKIVSPYIPEENISGDTLKINPGFIDAYNNGQWNGYAIFEGAEGCGQVTYYIPISSSRTLVMHQDLIGAFSDVSDPTNKAKILAIPGVISPDQSATIFNNIVQSLQVR